MINEEMARAMRYRAAFETTWLVHGGMSDNDRMRRRWLEHHLVELGRMEHAESETGIRNAWARRSWSARSRRGAARR